MDFEFEVRYFTSKVNFLQGFCVFELCGKLVLRDMFCLNRKSVLKANLCKCRATSQVPTEEQLVNHQFLFE